MIESQAVNTIDVINGVFVPPSAGGPLAFVNATPPDGVVGVPYSFTPLVTGGVYPLTFNYYGTLPPGIVCEPDDWSADRHPGRRPEASQVTTSSLDSGPPPNTHWESRASRSIRRQVHSSASRSARQRNHWDSR